MKRRWFLLLTVVIVAIVLYLFTQTLGPEGVPSAPGPISNVQSPEIEESEQS